ncbi:STAS domain-containing protein [Alteromonas sp. 009811495]|uniref:STAS domain-containing protein n=1 Tax=Alteromonas sp. 009811495 TaxID=3002962 RepID=UPI00237DA917|nr:STAS domain-containing protein [Alteromonas sp. 009811495]WDT84580.1 STAS domain-containing protein [Alteromonas sp. 009811495]
MENVAISRKQIGGESPIVASEIFDSCIYSGFFGTIDSARMAAITDKLIKMIEASSYTVAIIDLSNVDAIDSSVASQFVQSADTLKLLGVRTIFCGIRGGVAVTMVKTGIVLGHYTVKKRLKEAISEALNHLGLTISPCES